MSINDDLVKAIKANDISALTALLNQNPEELLKSRHWIVNGNGYGGGAVLHCAASYDRPAIIEFLINHKETNVNQKISEGWLPLKYAADNKAYKAAAMLVILGADVPPYLTAFLQSTEFIKAQEEIKELVDQNYLEKKRQEKISGIWTRLTDKEVMHEYELPDSHYQLTDTFNFETRSWQSITKDLNDKSITKNILFFDDIPDTEILHQACQKLKELKGSPDESLIDSRPLAGKMLAPKKLGER